MSISWHHIGIYTPVIVLLYFLAVRAIFVYQREHVATAVAQIANRYPHITLRQAWLGYAGNAIIVVGAGIWLPFIGAEIARVMQWQNSFVGTLFVASATSLPELTVTIAALRLRAIDMAIANILGSNLFDIVILAIDDLLYIKSPLLSHISELHAVTALSAVIMSGIVIIGLLYKPRQRILRTVGWISISLVTIYLLNSYIIYLYGE